MRSFNSVWQRAFLYLRLNWPHVQEKLHARSRVLRLLDTLTWPWTNYPGDLVQTLGSGILVTSSTRASSRHLLVLVENHLFILIIYLHLNPSTYTYLSFSSNCLSAHLYLPTVKTYSVAKFFLSEKIVTVFIFKPGGNN